MIHVATVHWRHDHWIDPQLSYLERFLPACREHDGAACTKHAAERVQVVLVVVDTDDNRLARVLLQRPAQLGLRDLDAARQWQRPDRVRTRDRHLVDLADGA